MVTKLDNPNLNVFRWYVYNSTAHDIIIYGLLASGGYETARSHQIRDIDPMLV